MGSVGDSCRNTWRRTSSPRWNRTGLPQHLV